MIVALMPFLLHGVRTASILIVKCLYQKELYGVTFMVLALNMISFVQTEKGKQMELIDREKLEVEICSACSPGSGLRSKDTCKLIQIVDRIPTVDAVPRSEYERVCRERDAVMEDLTFMMNNRIYRPCRVCKHILDYIGRDLICEQCKYYSDTDKESKWEWRGIKE